jgi:hypothetical protein
MVNDKAQREPQSRPASIRGRTRTCVSPEEALACLSVRSMNKPRGAGNKIGIWNFERGSKNRAAAGGR